MILYTKPNCSACSVIKTLLDNKGVEYIPIDDEDVYMPIARKNKCFQMPFAEIDGRVYDLKALQEWIGAQGDQCESCRLEK